MTQGRNPFRYLRPVPPQEFLGRWSMVEEIALDLTFDDGDSHACIGGRRSGKSSLLAALHHYLRQPETHKGDHLVLPLLIDFKRTFVSGATFFAHLLRELLRRVDANSRSRPRDPSPVKVSLDQAWVDSLLTGDPPGLSLTKFEEALSHILDQLHQADGPTRLIFLMDEVDDVLSYSWHRVLFSQLRSLIYAGDLSDNVRLVLSGSRRFLDSVTNRGSPLWNILKLHYLTAFDEPTTYELIARADNVPQAVQQAVWQQSGGHPFLTQYLLHHLWQEGLDQATDTTVAQIVNRFLHEEQAHLEGWANAIEEIGLRLYGHFVDQPGWLDEMDLIRAADDAPNVVKRGLVALSYHSLIIHDGSWSRYRRAGDLFLQWFLSEYQSQQKKGEQERNVTMSVTPKPAKPIEIFYSYSHKDEELRDELEKHLTILKRQGVIQGWHDRRIGAGKEWEGEVDEHLNTANIILLLISSDFLASDYCYDIEMKRAMERHDTGEARVIPVILRSVLWKGAPFGKLQALPTDAVPVTDWPNRDKAFENVAQGIRAAVEELIASP